MVKDKLKAFGKVFKAFIIPENEKWLVHSLQFLILTVLGGFTYLSVWLHQTLNSDPGAVFNETKAVPAYDTDKNVGLGESHIPKDILSRQDGVPEASHDLVETDIDKGRGVAAIIDTSSEISVDVGPLFQEFVQVSSGLKGESGNIAAVLEFDITFEIKDRATKAEMDARSIELKALIETMTSEFSKQELLTKNGKYALKKHLMSQINFRLKNGQVSDVLFSNFKIR